MRECSENIKVIALWQRPNVRNVTSNIIYDKHPVKYLLEYADAFDDNRIEEKIRRKKRNSLELEESRYPAVKE